MELSQLKSNLDSGESKFSLWRANIYCYQVKTDLTQRLQRCKTNDSTLESLLKNGTRCENKGLAAARQKLDACWSASDNLKPKSKHSRLAMKMLGCSQTASQYNLDDSQLGSRQELVICLSTRLQVAEKIAAVEYPSKARSLSLPNQPPIYGDEVAKYLVNHQSNWQARNNDCGQVHRVCSSQTCGIHVHNDKIF